MLFSVTSGMLPSVRPIASRPAKPEINVGRGERVQVAVIPIGTLRHALGDVIGVGVRLAGRDVQHHIVGVTLGADMYAVNMQVDRR